MILKARLGFGNLHCITPTDPSGEDEPYLWVFFIKVDGSTLRQRTTDPTQLSANVTVTAGPGRPGNLNVSSIQSGGNIHIPPAVGEFETMLIPIILNLQLAGAPLRIFLAGEIMAICIAIDEDSTPRDVMEGAFNAVKDLIATSTNDFLNGLTIARLADGIAGNPDPLSVVQRNFRTQLSTFITSLQQQATALVTQHVLADIAANNSLWNFFSTATKLADPDETIGFQRFSFDEVAVLNSNSAPINGDLRQTPGGLSGAWYTLQGALSRSASLVSTDVLSVTLPEVVKPMGNPEQHEFQRDHPCIAAGTAVVVSRFGHVETYEISVQYPFLTYRYLVDGQLLDGNGGVLQLTKEVRIPEFNEDSLKLASLFVKHRTETRQVKINFSKRRPPDDPQIEELILSNDPNDGNYDVSVTIVAIQTDGRTIPVGTVPVFFEGQVLSIPPDFAKGIQKCLENFVGTKWSKSKRVTQIDLWGPVAKRLRYELGVQELDALAAVGAYESEVVDAAKATLRKALGLKRL